MPRSSFFLLPHNFQWLHTQGLTLTPEERINRTIRVIINFLRFSASVEWRFLSFAIDWRFSLPLCCWRLLRPSTNWREQEKKNFIFNLLSLDSDSARDFIITSANISYRLSLIVVRYSCSPWQCAACLLQLLCWVMILMISLWTENPDRNFFIRWQSRRSSFHSESSSF